MTQKIKLEKMYSSSHGWLTGQVQIETACTVKVLGYFNHILVTSVALLLCVHVTHIKFKKCLQFEVWS